MAPYIGTGVSIGSGVLFAQQDTGAPVAAANNILWLDANDLTLGAGTTWTDRSAAGNNGTFVASPTISDGWTGSRRMVTFNGSTQYLTANGVAASVTGDDKPFSVALVYQLVADPAAYYGIWSVNRAATATPKFDFYKNNSAGGAFVMYNQGDTGGASGPGAGTSGTATQVLICSHTGTAISSWFNGVLKHNAAANDAGSKTLDLFTVGALRRGGVLSFPANMRLTAARAWNIALDSTQVAAETATLSGQWGV